mmetsp:Transcript_15058/g.17041  ORF Transcript_15058/g.17041 Transcript_15058/m.17041 type:complete len:92 (-) Transcript_15058:201-476(-)
MRLRSRSGASFMSVLDPFDTSKFSTQSLLTVSEVQQNVKELLLKHFTRHISESCYNVVYFCAWNILVCYCSNKLSIVSTNKNSMFTFEFLA